VLNLGLVAALVAVGITAHSLAVLAEGSDYLLDAAGVTVALRLDPAVALIIAVVIAYHAVALLRKVLARLRSPKALEPRTKAADPD